MTYLYKGKPVILIEMTHIYQGKQYCTIQMRNYLGDWQRQSVQFSKLVEAKDEQR